jgi:SAM-dependent MidA family methyltransferase
MSLEARLKAQIAVGGPLSVAQYMTLCLHDPAGGYYAVRPRLGEAGDFITAPLVSQMFGELVGLWCVEAWVRLGRPRRFLWTEFGPGDGTLISDALRAARLEPDFLEAADLWLVEPSAPLREAQRARLGGAPVQPAWAMDLQGLPEGAPLIAVGNEVLDCLPAQQFVRTGSGWAERMVGLDETGELAFGLAPRPTDTAFPEAPAGAVLEVSPAQEAMGADLGRRVAQDGGAALLIDYGEAGPGFGDTLQAVRGHGRQTPLQAPGEADLTVHAQFAAVLAAARREGAMTAQVLTQRAFLLRLGIEARAQALAKARPDCADLIGRQLQRLIARGEMGELFKAACIHSPGLAPPAFEEP